jgi:hypothetical protein
VCLELSGIKLHAQSSAQALELLQLMLRHLSAAELSRMLGVSERTIGRWGRQGRLPTDGSGGVMLFNLLRGPHSGSPAASPRQGAGAGGKRPRRGR